MVAAYEFMVVTSAIANLIREGKTFRINSALQTGRKYGMQLMDDALFNLWKNQLCEESDVVVRANNPGDLRDKIAKAKKGILEDDESEEEGDE
jgi:twitching motility protein PilT